MVDLQCPFSKCYPNLEKQYKNPCKRTPFHSLRELCDHIWKYHSNLLGCDMCNHRFPQKRGAKHRAYLDECKRKHNEKHHSDYDDFRSPDNDLMIITMSKEVDEKFKNWQGKGKDYSVELQYRSLCRCLFGDSIRVPSNISLDFMIPKYQLDKEYSELGEQNLNDARYRQLAPPSIFATTSSSSSSSSSTYQYANLADPATTTQIHYYHGAVDRLTLEQDNDDNDNTPQVTSWLVPQKPSDQDSGCYSGGDGFVNTPDGGGAHYPNVNQLIPQYVANNNDVVMGDYDYLGPAPGPSADYANMPLEINFGFELGGFDDPTDDENYHKSN